jgi:hypothetical protein
LQLQRRFPKSVSGRTTSPFAEALAVATSCSPRHVSTATCGLEIYIPFDEPTFLANSVDFAGGNWRDRYFVAKSKATLHVMPDELGPLPAGENAYERNNRWMLERAARFGDERIAFISLWDGQGGDGPGGARHLMDEARRRTKRIYWLNTTRGMGLGGFSICLFVS